MLASILGKLRYLDLKRRDPAAAGVEEDVHPLEEFATRPMLGKLLLVIIAILAFSFFSMVHRSVVLASVFCVPGIVLCSYLISRWHLLSRFKYPEARKLTGMIEENHLYDMEEESLPSGAKRSAVVNCLRLSVCRRAGDLVVTAYKRGDKYFEQTSKLAPLLTGVFGVEPDAVEDSPKFCRYVWLAPEHKDKRLVVSEDWFSAPLPEPSSVFPLTEQLAVDLAKTPHLLVCGGTGGGKSVFINYLVLMALRNKCSIFVADPKRSDLYGALRPILGPEHVGSEPGEIAKLARLVSEEMERRYRVMEQDFKMGSDFRDHALNPLLFVADEMAALQADADKKVAAEIMERLTSIIMKGRQAGVFCLLATQQPRTDVLPSNLRDQLGVRTSLGSLSREGYQMAFGAQGQGYDFAPREGAGTGYIYLDDGKMQAPQPFDAPWIDFSKIDFVSVARRLYEAQQPPCVEAAPAADGAVEVA